MVIKNSEMATQTRNTYKLRKDGNELIRFPTKSDRMFDLTTTWVCNIQTYKVSNPVPTPDTMPGLENGFEKPTF